MNTSLSWIKTYVPDLDVTAQEYTDAMTLTGTKVEAEWTTEHVDEEQLEPSAYSDMPLFPLR